MRADCAGGLVFRPESDDGMTAPLRCPVRNCGQRLLREVARVVCPSGHSFDIARSGYVSLLQPQDRRSRAPGDSAAAVAARRRLAESGIEAGVVAGLAGFAARITTGRAGLMLDAGCGEGSVTIALSVATGLEAVGVDIAAPAVDRAARKYPGPAWIVANADRELPFDAAQFALVTSIVARRNPPEFARLLEPEGVCLVVVPGADDLVELREAVLGEAVGRDRTVTVETEFADGFEPIGRATVRDRVRLDRAAIGDVLAATYRGARTAERERVAGLDCMTVTLHREAMGFRRRR